MNEKQTIRSKITHGAIKVAIPMAIHYAYKTFVNDDCVVSDKIDFIDNNLYYKIFFYDMLKDICINNYGWTNNDAIMREALDVGFTLIDSDEAYSNGLKIFYNKLATHFYNELERNGFDLSKIIKE